MTGSAWRGRRQHRFCRDFFGAQVREKEVAEKQVADLTAQLADAEQLLAEGPNATATKDKAAEAINADIAGVRLKALGAPENAGGEQEALRPTVSFPRLMHREQRSVKFLWFVCRSLQRIACLRANAFHIVVRSLRCRQCRDCHNALLDQELLDVSQLRSQTGYFFLCRLFLPRVLLRKFPTKALPLSRPSCSPLSWGLDS